MSDEMLVEPRLRFSGRFKVVVNLPADGDICSPAKG